MTDCWNRRCSSSECDGSYHIDADGKSWSETPKVRRRLVPVLQKLADGDWDDIEQPNDQADARDLLDIYREYVPHKTFRVIQRPTDLVCAGT